MSDQSVDPTSPDALAGPQLRLAAYAEVVRAQNSLTGTATTHWVAVDADDIVLWEEEDRDDARRRLTAEFDSDPAAQERVRLLGVRASGEHFVEWPRGGTPRERAVALRRRLNDMSVGLEGAHIVEHAAAHYLRASMCALEHSAPAPPSRVVHLSWLDATGATVPVGLLLQDERGGWRLLADERTPELGEFEVRRRIAQWASHLTAAKIEAMHVQTIADGDTNLLPPMTQQLIEGAINLARRLSLLPTADD